MVNNKDFANRLKKVMEFHQLTATSFADQIAVQRSSISHILSGRNKPSLDFVLKVTANFKDVDIYWLLKGEGQFPALKKQSSTPTPTQQPFQSVSKTNSTETQKQIQRIVVFYEDGTFEEYLK
ncbi:transcriptional regulator [Polaribacter pacificus]|uniref:Transcriptional regulator n=1 Tax=Polaribacter pacificus TaxID=1775173 RepID=A0A917MFZ4_9FLAO|nr:helix-turn-helix transcriptional regulator [Polaribacter pacificus]GGG98515.1 transcriptional regulator [Polaribacter pacificus]